MKKLITSILYNKRSERFIIALLILNILVFYCGVDQLVTNYIYIQIFDWFSMVIFTLEYVLRVCIVEKPKDILKPLLLMDLIAILPYYLVFLPFKTTFLRLITGYGDFYPAALVGRILDSVSLVICAGVHCLIIDLLAPFIIKFLQSKGINVPFKPRRSIL